MSSVANSRGQATIAALVILPVALAIFMTLFILGAALSIEARAVAACRASMQESQEAAAEAIRNLERLNPLAKNLERLRRGAEIGLKVAKLTMLPNLIAGAYATKYAVAALQRPVQLKQKYWYMRGKTASLLAPAKALGAMQESLPKGFLGRLTKSLLMPSVSSMTSAATTLARSEIRTARFHMIQTPPGARTPVYRPAPSFTRTQNARVQWLLRLPVEQIEDDDWFPRIEIPSLKLGCEMTLVKGALEKWVPRITEDKLLRN